MKNAGHAEDAAEFVLGEELFEVVHGSREGGRTEEALKGIVMERKE
jgi:hypothetical protein